MTAPRTPGFALKVLATDGHARAGILTTPHGDVPLPTFMPVGTQGSVKTLTPEEVASTGARVVLGNTYHLWQRPGPELVAALGGLHGFTRWPHAMLTDSGTVEIARATRISISTTSTTTTTLICVSISASFACTSWCPAIGLPANCTRCFA